MRIVADASALLAILLGEEDADGYLSKLLIAETVWLSPVNWWKVEVRMQSRYGEAGGVRSVRLMNEIGIVLEPVTIEHAQIALAAFGRYRGRPVKLNLGDCFAYALASAKNAPLLYKGRDFEKTGLRSV